MYLKFAKVRDVAAPERAHTGVDAGCDFRIPSDFRSRILFPGESICIPSGIKLEIPIGTAFVIQNKSGIASKKGLLVGAEICDANYAGEIHIDVHNVGQQEVELTPGMKIAQGILYPILTPEFIEVDDSVLYKDILVASERGAGGFGHTGA